MQVAEHKGITAEFHWTEREILTPIPPMANNRTGPGLIVDGIYDENDSRPDGGSEAAAAVFGRTSVPGHTFFSSFSHEK